VRRCISILRIAMGLVAPPMSIGRLLSVGFFFNMILSTCACVMKLSAFRSISFRCFGRYVFNSATEGTGSFSADSFVRTPRYQFVLFILVTSESLIRSVSCESCAA